MQASSAPAFELWRFLTEQCSLARLGHAQYVRLSVREESEQVGVVCGKIARWSGTKEVISLGAKKQTDENKVRVPTVLAGAKAFRGPRGRVFTREAGLFKMIGIGDSGVPGGYSSRKHELTDCGEKHHPHGE